MDITRVWVCDRSGREDPARYDGHRWRCPHDGGDLGDSGGYRAARIGNQCELCGRVVCRVMLQDAPGGQTCGRY